MRKMRFSLASVIGLLTIFKIIMPWLKKKDVYDSYKPKIIKNNKPTTVILVKDDIVEMKKAHPCGGNRAAIMEIGTNVQLKCLYCGNIFSVPNKKFEKKIKRVL